MEKWIAIIKEWQDCPERSNDLWRQQQNLKELAEVTEKLKDLLLQQVLVI